MAASTEMSAYPVISRPRNLMQWDNEEDEKNISFDGSVAAIQALALEKADYLANNPPGNDRGPPEDVANPATCDGTLTQDILKLEFEYSVEYDANYDPSQESKRKLEESDVKEIAKEIEKELQIQLSNAILTCKVDDPEVQNASVVGLVRIPRNKPVNDGKCDYLFIAI